MNKRALSILEFDKIITRLEAHASSVPGRLRCSRLQPGSDLTEIELMQEQTSAALSRLFRKSQVTFEGVREIGPSLKRLAIGRALNAEELLNIARLLENTARVKSYGRRENNDTETDCLEALFAVLEPLTPLSAEIRRCILSQDEISDDASPELKRIRRSIQLNGDRIHSQLNTMLNGSLRTYLQDSVITMRNGRYCVPVKAEYRNQVAGMIHDQSSSGSTLFVEPMVIVRLNNEIRELEQAERKEIDRILAALSLQAGEHLEILETDLETMSELDFIFARGRLAMEMNATKPLFNTEGIIQLRKARHPLIDPKVVVPIDLTLGEDFDLLIVTGPNTGGKTVSLKTVGLLTLMGQAGLHIPTLDRSRLSVFRKVYADIGDEQSIEQSLSTFSSHMKNVVAFLKNADRDSLVLFDELGAGTDPTEGAALAIAILSHLHERGIRTMATTHYSELKVYALSTPGVENASCEFDIKTLRPTYRLLVGIPGKSNAFAISEKLGLPRYIIRRAKEQINEQDESFEDMMINLEQNRVRLEKEKESLERLRREAEQEQKELSKQNAHLAEQKSALLQKAREEANAILREAKEFADQTMRDFQKFGKKNISAKEMEQHREQLRKKIKDTQSDLSIKPTSRKGKALRPEDLSIGDSVRVLSMNVKGTVSTRPDSRGFLFVQMGIIRSKVNITDLELIDEPVITGQGLSRTGTGKVNMSKSASIKPEINLLGKTVDEAIAELDKYLDDAYISHLSTVRVVHGKGTGALRKGVHNYLRTQRHVAEYHLAAYGEGDSGVTIVTFR